jgi:hypothetical protein
MVCGERRPYRLCARRRPPRRLHGRQGDDGHPPAVFRLLYRANHLRRLKTINVWHAAVHQVEVVLLYPEGLNGCGAAVNQSRFDAEAAKRGLRDFEVHGAVVGDQNVRTGEARQSVGLMRLVVK